MDLAVIVLDVVVSPFVCVIDCAQVIHPLCVVKFPPFEVKLPPSYMLFKLFKQLRRDDRAFLHVVPLAIR